MCLCPRRVIWAAWLAWSYVWLTSAAAQEPLRYGQMGDLPSPEAAPAEDFAAFGASASHDSAGWLDPSWRPLPPGHSLWPRHWRHGDPNDPARHVGIGKPLSGTSWLNRPYYAGWLAGVLWGSTLIDGELEQQDDLLGGLRLGWDFDHYFGTELRVAFADLALWDAQGTDGRTVQNLYWDLNLLYYPWGDAAWRPFASLGLGGACFRYENAGGEVFDEVLFTIPLGIGVKYYCRPWLALRTTVTDNFAIGSGRLDTMHNLSWTAGVEVHFGGPRRGYYPYHPGGYIW